MWSNEGLPPPLAKIANNLHIKPKKKKKLKEPPQTLVPIPSEHIKDLELRSIQTGTRWSDTPTTVQWDDEDLIVVTRLVSHCVIFLGH